MRRAARSPRPRRSSRWGGTGTGERARVPSRGTARRVRAPSTPAASVVAHPPGARSERRGPLTTPFPSPRPTENHRGASTWAADRSRVRPSRLLTPRRSAPAGRSRSPPTERIEPDGELSELLGQRAQLGVGAGRPRHQHHVGAGTPRDLPSRFTQQALRPVAGDRGAHLPRSDDGQPHRLVGTRTQVDHDQTARPLGASTQDGRDLTAVTQPFHGGRGHGRQADSFARPRRRRLRMMERPPRVLMRARKPCFLARRRLLGWKVRFDTTDASRGSG